MNMIGFLASCFLGMSLLNHIAGGAFVSAADVAIVNTLTITHDVTIFGSFSIPLLNTDFFFTGIPHLVRWDYSFFGGNAAIFAYFLYALTFAVSFMLFLALAAMVSNYFARR